MSKRVVSISFGEKPGPPSQRTLATYNMNGNKLEAHYVHPIFQKEMETTGILARGRTVYPADGRAFYDALDKAFANSTHRGVIVDK